MLMPTRKSHVFYGLLIALTSAVAGMVLASRLDLAPASIAGTLDVPATNSAPLDGPLDASTFRTIAEASSPSVVSIVVTSRRQGPRSIADLFGFEGDADPRSDGPQLQQGAGSGFIIDRDGFILTNNHVVADAQRIEVKLEGMDELEPGIPAELVGRDELTDAALIRLTSAPPVPLTVSTFGDSDQLSQGDWVMAIGNPFGLSGTVTVGVVSAVGRLQSTAVSQRFERMIQTDAAINRGNSGGPLLNIRGEVVGINTMIVSDQGGGNLGIGFAVPINTVKELLPALRTGKVTRGRIGIALSRTPITPADADDLGLPRPGGAIVSTVGRGGPADRAGLQVADVIVEYNGQPVRNDDELVSMVVRTAPGTTVPLQVVRNRRTIALEVTVEELNLDDERASASRSRAQRPERREPVDAAFGITINSVTPDIMQELNVPRGRGGAVVEEVTPYSPASGNLVRGDVILSVNGTEARSVEEVGAALDAVPSGRTARLIVWRQQNGGQEQLVLIRKR
jgi:serine protease Do